jgi:hypothetical protein
MNNVHHCLILYNMSPNNIMLHFPPNFINKVFINICNWATVRNFNDLKESLYIHKSEETKSKIMQHMWWVTPKLHSTTFMEHKGCTVQEAAKIYSKE